MGGAARGSCIVEEALRWLWYVLNAAITTGSKFEVPDGSDQYAAQIGLGR